MNNLAFVHIINENLGDASCCPKSHFKAFDGCPEVDFRAMPEEMLSPPWTLIVGGGGLLHPGIDVWIHKRAKAQRVILWGVGLNYHDGLPLPPWRDLVKPCELVTIRDAAPASETGVLFCPCPSCLATDFSLARDLPAARDVVVFEHYQRRLKLPFPTRDNLRVPRWGFSQAVAFLASGRRVITNSFHGAYWAALLGRPVLVYQPFSTRFRSGLLFRDFAGTPEEVRAWLTREVLAPPANYLDECRRINRLMFDRVQTILENPA
jgi:hypothetical protein